MADVRTLVSEIKEALTGVGEKIRKHPYVGALEAGEIKRERLRIFAEEQYHIISSDVRSVALLLSRWGYGQPSLEFFWMVLQGEVEALRFLLRFASALELPEERLKAYDALAGAQAYKAYMSWLAQYGTDAEVAGALLVNFPAWGENCGRMSRALKKNYGLSNKDVAFFDLFATPAADFEEKAVAVIERGLSRGVAHLAIKTAARMLQDYELLFWETLWEASIL